MITSTILYRHLEPLKAQIGNLALEVELLKKKFEENLTREELEENLSILDAKLQNYPAMCITFSQLPVISEFLACYEALYQVEGNLKLLYAPLLEACLRK